MSNANPLGDATKAAAAFVVSHVRSHTDSLKVQTFRGNHLSSLTVRMENSAAFVRQKSFSSTISRKGLQRVNALHIRVPLNTAFTRLSKVEGPDKARPCALAPPCLHRRPSNLCCCIGAHGRLAPSAHEPLPAPKHPGVPHAHYFDRFATESRWQPPLRLLCRVTHRAHVRG